MWLPILRDQWGPFADVQGLQREMNRLFTTLSRRSDRTATPPEVSWTPSTDIYETTDEMIAVVEVPGVDRSEIEISVVEDTLTVRGRRHQKEQVQDEHYLRGERHFGPFVRTLALPSVVDTDRIKATYKDGLLEIRLPKRDEAKPRPIPIEVA
jgi:HSP20 family protein